MSGHVFVVGTSRGRSAEGRARAGPGTRCCGCCVNWATAIEGRSGDGAAVHQVGHRRPGRARLLRARRRGGHAVRLGGRAAAGRDRVGLGQRHAGPAGRPPVVGRRPGVDGDERAGAGGRRGPPGRLATPPHPRRAALAGRLRGAGAGPDALVQPGCPRLGRRGTRRSAGGEPGSARWLGWSQLAAVPGLVRLQHGEHRRLRALARTRPGWWNRRLQERPVTAPGGGAPQAP